MNIIGVSAFYHESACCLLQNGNLVAAAAEERFTRLKHDPRLPVHAFRYCLQAAGLTIADVDCIAYYESPHKKLSRQEWSLARQRVPTPNPRLDAAMPERLIRERFGYTGKVLTFDHHQSHAASAFFYSGCERAAVLTVDGVGEWTTTTYGRGDGVALDIFEEVHFPHSLGLLYATLTAYLGFQVNSDEYKVMGLAGYGRPRYADKIWQMMRDMPGGQYQLEMAYFDFVAGDTMYSPSLVDLLGQPPRPAGEPVMQFHEDVAASIQLVLEEMLLRKVRYLHQYTGESRLCMAGGVALNSVANGRIRREGPFDDLFIQPAAGDAGGCLGAAALAYTQLAGRRPEATMRDARLGPAFAPDDLARLVLATGPAAQDFRGREQALLEAMVDRLAAGQVVGWFHGRMEFGPRALGARSILADPTNPTARDRINRLVKQREPFRPFAPSVLADHAAAHFDLPHPSPFMLETCAVRSPIALPAITHVDGSARPQTVDAATHPRFAALLSAFYRRTGCPMLLNTSFNQAGEPIVCTPADALLCFVNARLDALVLEDWLFDRAGAPEVRLFPQSRTSSLEDSPADGGAVPGTPEVRLFPQSRTSSLDDALSYGVAVPGNWPELAAAWVSQTPSLSDAVRSPLGENLYTFV